MAPFACYCQAYADLVAARADIDEHGRFQTNTQGYEQLRPAVLVAQKAMQLIKAFAAEFGCSPSSRGRINLPGREDEISDLID